MTLLCVATGQVFLGQGLHQLDELLPANSLPLDDIFAAGLLIFFGVKTLLVRTPTRPAEHLKPCKTRHSAGTISQYGALFKHGVQTLSKALTGCAAGRERGRRERRGREGRGREGSGAHGQRCGPASDACVHSAGLRPGHAVTQACTQAALLSFAAKQLDCLCVAREPENLSQRTLCCVGFPFRV